MTPHECIIVCHALASSGHLEEARQNLRRNAPCLECGEGIDLLARIELALGNEGEAKHLWEEAAKKGLGDEACCGALAALGSTAWRLRAVVRFLKHFLRIAAILAVGFLLGVFRNGCGTTNAVEAGIAEGTKAPTAAMEPPAETTPEASAGEQP